MGAAKITENWQERIAERAVGPVKSATRVYDVELDGTDATNDEPFISLTANDGTLAIPVYGAAHSFHDDIFVRSIRSRCTGPKLYQVTVAYGLPSSSDDQGGDDINPLSKDPEASWSFAASNEQIDEDINNVALKNSADETFDPPLTKDFHDQVLRIAKNQAGYNKSEATAYKDAINASTWFDFAAETVKCIIYDGTLKYWNEVPYWEVVYEFQIRKDGWKRRVLDEGFREKTGVSGGKATYANIKDANGEPISEPVQLDGAGMIKNDAAADVFLVFEVDEKKTFDVFNSLLV